MDEAHDFEVPAAWEGADDNRHLPLRRLVVRAAAFIATIVIAELAVSYFFPLPDFDMDYRLPQAMPASELAPLADHIDRNAASRGEPIVVFLGSSPTWGNAVALDTETVPSAFRRAAEKDGVQLSVYNLASDGQLLGDQYFIAKRVAKQASLVLVQLNYFGFSPAWRDGATSRYPETAERLGVPVDAQVASILGRAPSPGSRLTSNVDWWFKSRWRLYGAAETISGDLLGATPENRLHRAWQGVMDGDIQGERAMRWTGKRFDDLEPDQQMLILDEVADGADYEIDPSDSELLMLDKLASDLQDAGVRAVFYPAPLNVSALESYDLYDRTQHAANRAALRSVVTRHGHKYLNIYTRKPLPSGAFADISHTTAEGNERVATRLWREVSGLIEKSP